MKELGSYSNINARVRVLLSYLLKKEQWQSVFASSDIDNFISRLENTRYAPWAKNLTAEEFVYSIDKKILEESLSAEKRLKYFLPEIPAKIIGLLTEEYDIEQLKTALMSWHKKVEFSVPAAQCLSGRYEINWKIFNEPQTSLDHIIESLKHTPYGNPLSCAKDLFKKTASIFFLETALEKDLFERIWKQVKSLDGNDKLVVSRILGIQTDILNIQNMLRCKLFFQLPNDKLEYIIYPNGKNLSYKKCYESYTSLSQSDMIGKISAAPFDALSNLTKLPELKSSYGLINEILTEAMHRQIQKVLCGYPFTFGVTLAYILLNRWELKQVRFLCWSLYLGNKDYSKEIQFLRS